MVILPIIVTCHACLAALHIPSVRLVAIETLSLGVALNFMNTFFNVLMTCLTIRFANYNFLMRFVTFRTGPLHGRIWRKDFALHMHGFVTLQAC